MSQRTCYKDPLVPVRGTDSRRETSYGVWAGVEVLGGPQRSLRGECLNRGHSQLLRDRSSRGACGWSPPWWTGQRRGAVCPRGPGRAGGPVTDRPVPCRSPAVPGPARQHPARPATPAHHLQPSAPHLLLQAPQRPGQAGGCPPRARPGAQRTGLPRGARWNGPRGPGMSGWGPGRLCSRLCWGRPAGACQDLRRSLPGRASSRCAARPCPAASSSASCASVSPP